jgi:predicted alpha/beta hydrolase family esterase
MTKHILFIHGGGGEGVYEIDGLLVSSLQNALGADYEVRYPKMPLEESAGYAEWKAQIAAELSALDDKVILIAHSVGGAILLKYLMEEPVEIPIAGLFLLATPFFGGDGIWQDAQMTLPPDFALLLPPIPRIFLYHSRDDEVVPFAHLALYAAKLPKAILREFDGRGHQFGNNLTEVAEDIRRTEQS